ncbi:hypothetical protein [Methylocystis heyeri]|uniref:Uncharacterized protein n=1 Tax=Methylocystis heyeri TaxID=391905 RepID=A0A6B8KLZ3_9HYPH|nr:hypothetical protein [Methylocystis heyeri]QGM48261.1 hypothetical protein H2LOC_020970 [Methylocystis heyeri]
MTVSWGNAVGFLFVIALVLAWPTFGASLVIWWILAAKNAKDKIRAIEQREKNAAHLEPLFKNNFAAFFLSLDVPIKYGSYFTSNEAELCGRYIMIYLANNPEEAELFIEGLKKWKTKGSYELAEPVIAAECEISCRQKLHVHLASYRAIEALVANNNLACFSPVNYNEVVQYRMLTELGRPTGRSTYI